MAAADQRQGRGEGRQAGEAVEEGVLGSEDDGRAQDHRRGEDSAHGGLAGGLGAGVLGGRGRIGADGRHLHEAGDSPGGGGLGDGAGGLGVQGRKALAAALVEHPDQVHAGLGPVQRPADRGGVADIGLDHLDLADVAQHAQAVAATDVPGRDADAPALFRQRPDDLATDEAGASKDGDEPTHVAAFEFQ